MMRCCRCITADACAGPGAGSGRCLHGLRFEKCRVGAPQAFAQRRKTLRNNLKGTFTDEALTSVGIEPDWRAERLQLEDFVNLARLT